jgi:hypothetical protein
MESELFDYDGDYGSDEEDDGESLAEAMRDLLGPAASGAASGAAARLPRPPTTSSAIPQDSPAGATRADVAARAGLAAPLPPSLAASAGPLPSPDAPDAPAPQAGYDSLKTRYQVDLNNAANLADLEDPRLRTHMELARQRLAEYQLGVLKLPQLDELVKGDTAGRRDLSALMVTLKEQQMALQCACDDLILQESNVGRLANGEQPHGYPALGTRRAPAAPASPARDGSGVPEGLAQNLGHLAKKLASIGAGLGESVKAVESFERSLTLARRNYETVVDGLRRRQDHYELAYREATALARADAFVAQDGAPATAEGAVVPAEKSA